MDYVAFEIYIIICVHLRNRQVFWIIMIKWVRYFCSVTASSAINDKERTLSFCVAMCETRINTDWMQVSNLVSRGFAVPNRLSDTDAKPHD